MDQALYEFLELTSDRLYLRGFRYTDIDQLYTIMSNPLIAEQTLLFDHLPSYEDVHLCVSEIVKKQTDVLEDFHWVIDYEGQCIGYIRLEKCSQNESQYTIGYCVDKTHWNKGFATEALNAVVDFAFELYDVSSVKVMIRIGNAASKKVAEKVGMKYTGILREEYRYGDTACDVEVCSLLRVEWERMQNSID